MSFTMLNPAVTRTVFNPSVIRNIVPLPAWM